MPTTIEWSWGESGHVAWAQFPSGVGLSVDVDRPQTGCTLTGLPAGINLPGLLTLDLPPRAAEAFRPEENYLRQADLIATYEEVGAETQRVQTYWRLPAVPVTGVLALVDLQLSTQTDRLDSDPTRWVRSVVPAGESLVIEPGQCRLVRSTAGPWSYVEMVHPTDGRGEELDERAEGGSLHLAERLFGDRLERGVILRGRLRVAIVERDADRALAEALYADLLAAPLPLTT